MEEFKEIYQEAFKMGHTAHLSIKMNNKMVDRHFECVRGMLPKYLDVVRSIWIRNECTHQYGVDAEMFIKTTTTSIEIRWNQKEYICENENRLVQVLSRFLSDPLVIEQMGIELS